MFLFNNETVVVPAHDVWLLASHDAAAAPHGLLSVSSPAVPASVPSPIASPVTPSHAPDGHAVASPAEHGSVLEVAYDPHSTATPEKNQSAELTAALVVSSSPRGGRVQWSGGRSSSGGVERAKAAESTQCQVVSGDTDRNQSRRQVRSRLGTPRHQHGHSTQHRGAQRSTEEL